MPAPSTESGLPRRLRFGVFEADLNECELRRQGLKVKLNEKPFQVLSVLLERAGSLVRREELRQRLWPADTYVDFDANLNTALSTLRHALGDSSENPVFIETVPRQGYRFIAPVTVVDEKTITPVQTAPVGSAIVTDAGPKTSTGSRKGALLWAAVVLLIVLSALGGLSYLRWVARSAEAKSASGKVTILVTPFENQSGDPNQEYLSDGLTDEMITRLGESSPKQVSVIARSTVMQYKGTQKTVGQIAREQHADYVLEGCMRRQGDRVRITAQLFSARNPGSLWADAYERDASDLLKIERDVTDKIAQSLSLNVLAPSASAAGVRNEVNPRAYDAYLKGLFQLNKRTPDSLQKSIFLFKEATQMDSHFSAAYASLAESYEVSAGWDFLRPEEAFLAANEAAQKAVSLDGGLSAAHSAYADVLHEYNWDWAEAEREYKRALELNPSSAMGHKLYAEYLTHAGRFSEALSEVQQAQQLDPLSLITHAMVCFVYNHWRQYDNAVQACQKVLDLDPNFVPAHYFLASAYMGKKMYSRALTELRTAADLSPNAYMMQTNQAYIYAVSGDKEKAAQALKALLKRSRQTYVSPFELAGVYAALGDRDEAFQMLDKAFEQHCSELMFLAHCPCLDSLHQDRRFQRMVERIGFPSTAVVD